MVWSLFVFIRMCVCMFAYVCVRFVCDVFCVVVSFVLVCGLCCVCVRLLNCVLCDIYCVVLYGVLCAVVCVVFVCFVLIMLNMCLCVWGTHCVML